MGLAPKILLLNKGELLFKEGDNSRAMYFIKRGMIRIFKSKGKSNVEIETLRAGQILGELAFIDGNPRSASCEAISNCELVEISGPTFNTTLQQMPDWLKLLLKTIVGRLRQAGIKLRQLESSSTSIDYSKKEGNRGIQYTFLGEMDILKILAGILLVAGHHGHGRTINISLLHTYVCSIMGVAISKITAVLDVLDEAGLVKVSGQYDSSDAILVDRNFIDQLITYLNAEAQAKEHSRHDITFRSFTIMSMIMKHIDRYEEDSATGLTLVNIAEIKKLELAASGQETFTMEDLNPLVQLGYCTAPEIKSTYEIYTGLKKEEFVLAYRFQRLVKGFEAVNEQKRSRAA